ncbi:MAG: G5 domain-containing protein [Bacillota bacterium]
MRPLTMFIGGAGRTRWITGLLALLVLIGLLVWSVTPEQHRITLYGLGEPISFVTTEQQLGRALKAQGIIIGAKDVVEPALSSSLKGQPELTVSVRPAVPVTVTVGGEVVRTYSAAASVGDLLVELGISLGEKDTLSAPLTAPLESGMTLQLIRRTEEFITVTEAIPFNEITRADAALPIGTTQILQAGEDGTKETRRRILREDGREVASEVIESTVAKAPIDQIVAYGTQGSVSRGGQEYRYSRELTMTATGYTAGKESNPDGNGYTYTGMKAVRGVVAVDPDVIPLYTRLYIEGYGPAIAADIGGAIKGNKIDLCFETVAEALEWGIRPVKVYILSD